jgi:hypothetical protein
MILLACAIFHVQFAFAIISFPVAYHQHKEQAPEQPEPRLGFCHHLHPTGAARLMQL